MDEVNQKELVLHSIIVPQNIQNVRLSDFAHEAFKTYLPSKKSIKKALKKNRIYLNGKPGFSGDYVSTGMKVALLSDVNVQPKSFELDLEILYEDDSLAVVNKPAGIPVSGNYFKTIQNALKHNLINSSLTDALAWPLPVHRLDALTSGCLLIAKTKKVQINLGRQFEAQKITKEYLAIVVGEAPIEGSICLKIDVQEATSKFKLQESVPSVTYGRISLLRLFPVTGRTHQLRIHCQDMGHPIVGDKMYFNKEKVLKGKGLFLNANKIIFEHPLTKMHLSIETTLPSKFRSYLIREESRFHKFNI